ncbi:MAG: hypothetical protein HYX25_03060 [Candidatus Solibacter usitatus]|nr:hypothetical protein [Candidatus Solibacter usitatus]
MKRAARALYWGVPSLLCLLLYWHGLRVWFQGDDFAWLGLARSVTGWRGVLHALLTPAAQGTIRPWSETGFFMSFYALFGLYALPYRMLVFATQFVNLVLVAAITRRLTRSDAAGFWAAIFWMVNTSLAQVMSWTSVYNQALCALFILLAFYCLLRAIETGRRSFWIAQWIVFLLGFGALELNVVYPALAAVYTLLCARPYFRRTLLLLVPSLAYAVVHAIAAPVTSTAYAMHLDRRIFTVLITYWQWSVGSAWMRTHLDLPPWFLPACVIVVSAALLSFAVWRTVRRDFLPLFFLSWFLIGIAPLLPFADHVTEYYPYVPTIGLAMLGGWAFALCWRQQAGWRALSCVVAALYVAAAAPEARYICDWEWEHSQAVKNLVLGVQRAHELHPGKAILLDGVNDTLFWKGVQDRPFRRLLDIQHVYVSPGTERNIEARPNGDVFEYILPPEATLRALDRDELVVYAAGGERLKNITSAYAALPVWDAEPPPPRLIDAANPLMRYSLGPTWYELDGFYRFMPKTATVRIAGPATKGEKLFLRGVCPEIETRQGPLDVTVAADGILLPTVRIAQGQFSFDFAFSLPAALVGKPRIEISVTAARTIRLPADSRDLSLAFGVFEVR